MAALTGSWETHSHSQHWPERVCHNPTTSELAILVGNLQCPIRSRSVLTVLTISPCADASVPLIPVHVGNLGLVGSKPLVGEFVTAKCLPNGMHHPNFEAAHDLLIGDPLCRRTEEITAMASAGGLRTSTRWYLAVVVRCLSVSMDTGGYRMAPPRSTK